MRTDEDEEEDEERQRASHEQERVGGNGEGDAGEHDPFGAESVRDLQRVIVSFRQGRRKSCRERTSSPSQREERAATDEKGRAQGQLQYSSASLV